MNYLVKLEFKCTANVQVEADSEEDAKEQALQIGWHDLEDDIEVELEDIEAIEWT